MVSLKDTAKAENISISEYLEKSRKIKRQKAENQSQYQCQICPYGQMASEKHIMCLLPQCLAKAKTRR